VSPRAIDVHQNAVKAEFLESANAHAVVVAREPFEAVSVEIRKLAEPDQALLRDVCIAIDRLGAFCSCLAESLDVVFPRASDDNDLTIADVRTAQRKLRTFSESHAVLFRRLRWTVAQSYAGPANSAGVRNRAGHPNVFEAAKWWSSADSVSARAPSTFEGLLLRATPWFGDQHLNDAWRAYLLPSSKPGVLDEVVGAIQWVLEAGPRESSQFVARRLQILCDQRSPGYDEMFFLAESPDSFVTKIASSVGLAYTPIPLYKPLKVEHKRLIANTRRWIDRQDSVSADISIDTPVRLDRLFLQEARSMTYYAGRAVFLRPLTE